MSNSQRVFLQNKFALSELTYFLLLPVMYIDTEVVLYSNLIPQKCLKEI